MFENFHSEELANGIGGLNALIEQLPENTPTRLLLVCTVREATKELVSRDNVIGFVDGNHEDMSWAELLN